MHSHDLLVGIHLAALRASQQLRFLWWPVLHRALSTTAIPDPFPRATGFSRISGTTDGREAATLGYGEPVLLGYLDACAPASGRLAVERPPLRWTHRWGRLGAR